MAVELGYGVEYCMTQVLKALNTSNKPIVGLVRGGAVGIGFTTTAHFDFIYCSPNAFFENFICFLQCALHGIIPITRRFSRFLRFLMVFKGGSTYLFPK